MTYLRPKRIVLGITGGVAAYKAAELTRLLVKAGHAVQVVMTEAATHFVTPLTFQALSGRPVFTDQWDERPDNGMPHIDLSRGADLLVVAPASADFLAKTVHGLANDLLSTLVLARDCPLLLAPAMNRQMWENPATQRNVALLHADGIGVLGPDSGSQACGETGMGRMLEPEVLQELIEDAFAPQSLRGQRVVLTAGPTFEAIDPVRGITNKSSGKMGYALARAARARGAEVILVTGPTALPPPYGVRSIPVESAGQMQEAVLREAGSADIFIGVAAVADYRVATPSAQKLKKQGDDLTLRLTQNPDILAAVAALDPGPFCVGFAAESENLLEYAEAKRRRKGVPLLVANIAQSAIGADDNEVILLEDTGQQRLPRADKTVLAGQIMDHIAARLT